MEVRLCTQRAGRDRHAGSLRKSACSANLPVQGFVDQTLGRRLRSTTVMGSAPVGSKVMAACTGMAASGVLIAKACTMMAVTSWISSIAICIPMQVRGPAPNGNQAWR